MSLSVPSGAVGRKGKGVSGFRSGRNKEAWARRVQGSHPKLFFRLLSYNIQLG
jgi:hypothetical protein